MTSNGSKILVNVPRLDLPGGVANFYRVLRGRMGPEVKYFEIGANAGQTGPASVLKRVLTDYVRFRRELSSGQYSIVHLNPSLVPKSIIRDAVFLLIARTQSVPVLVFFRGWDEEFLGLIKRRFTLLFRHIYGNTAGIIVLAEQFRHELEKMGCRAPIFRLTTCVDDTVFDFPPRSVNPGPITRILFLSRLDHGKGAVEALRSFRTFKQSNPQATLTIAGDGPERASAEQLVKRLAIRDVRFVGHVHGVEKHEVYCNSDIFFFPTFYGEGMPNSIVEAMAYGLPIVTRSIGGLRDFFQDGRMGFITESTDEAYFAKLLERLASNPSLRHRIGEHNRQYAKQHFSASSVAKHLERIYSHVLR